MAGTRVFTDMMNRNIEVAFPPKKIISVVPSQTELLFDLGLNAEIAGVTKFCIHPQFAAMKVRIGGTKTLALSRINSIYPDLIIANREENTKADIEFLAQNFPVWISDIHNLADAMEMIRGVSEIVGRPKEGRLLNAHIRKGFDGLKATKKSVKVAYFIWRNPWMTVGNDTFINDMLLRLGWQNVYQDKSRYPETDIQELKALNPDLILLSSEPYPFKEKHIAELKSYLPHARIELVDGEMFSWYGSRLKLAIPYFQQLLRQQEL